MKRLLFAMIIMIGFFFVDSVKASELATTSYADVDNDLLTTNPSPILCHYEDFIKDVLNRFEKKEESHKNTVDTIKKEIRIEFIDNDLQYPRHHQSYDCFLKKT
jgi:hypothetical protein